MTPGRIRLASVDDALRIARIHVQGWRETYPGIVPDRSLRAMSVDERYRFWLEILSDPGCGQSVFVAEIGPAIVGFGVCGPEQVGLSEFDGEIHALYLLRTVQGRGLGSSLMSVMAADLTDRAWTRISVWVLRDNWPARRFYERLGARRVAHRPLYFDGTEVMEMGYGWNDIRKLVRGCAEVSAVREGRR
ncbi:MAG: GNAT family N-acetyltransferase [Azospirillaceae bacterium]|nr:GNAT family N-acetyltransferase [Azospirillaceae bacterium]